MSGTRHRERQHGGRGRRRRRGAEHRAARARPCPPTRAARPQLPTARGDRLGALVLAAADLHAGRADPAVPAVAGGDPRLAGPAGRATTPVKVADLPREAHRRSARSTTDARPLPRLQLGVVLRDLHPAVHLAGRLHRPAHLAVRRPAARPAAGAPRAGWTGCPRTRPGAPRRTPSRCSPRPAPALREAALPDRTPATGRWPPRRATCARPATCSSTSRCSAC